MTDLIVDIIRSRRSIYPALYTGAEVADEVVNRMLESANWAPNHRLTEPWRFVVFKGEGIKRLAKFQSELYRENTEANGTFDQAKFEKLAAKPVLCSHIISIGMKRHDVVPEVEEISAVACAVQNMWLTATAHKIGCYWGTGGVTYYPEAKSFFDLEEEDRLMGFLYLGMPKKWPDGKRDSISQKIKWVQ